MPTDTDLIYMCHAIFPKLRVNLDPFITLCLFISTVPFCLLIRPWQNFISECRSSAFLFWSSLMYDQRLRVAGLHQLVVGSSGLEGVGVWLWLLATRLPQGSWGHLPQGCATWTRASTGSSGRRRGIWEESQDCQSNKVADYCGRKGQTSYHARFLSYAAHFSPTLAKFLVSASQISLLC